MNLAKLPRRLVTLENGTRVARVYPTFARAWDARVDAGVRGHAVVSCEIISEDEYQREKE